MLIRANAVYTYAFYTFVVSIEIPPVHCVPSLDTLAGGPWGGRAPDNPYIVSTTAAGFCTVRFTPPLIETMP